MSCLNCSLAGYLPAHCNVATLNKFYCLSVSVVFCFQRVKIIWCFLFFSFCLSVLALLICQGVSFGAGGSLFLPRTLPGKVICPMLCLMGSFQAIEHHLSSC